MKIKQLRAALAAVQSLCARAGDAEMASVLGQLSATLKSSDADEVSAFTQRMRALRERTSRE